jgi:hypothetical protein
MRTLPERRRLEAEAAGDGGEQLARVIAVSSSGLGR